MDNYLIGKLELTHFGFIHLEVAVLSGRNPELLKAISQNLVKLLHDNLLDANCDLDFDISVEIRNLSDNYAKREITTSRS